MKKFKIKDLIEELDVWGNKAELVELDNDHCEASIEEEVKYLEVGSSNKDNKTKAIFRVTYNNNVKRAWISERVVNCESGRKIDLRASALIRLERCYDLSEGSYEGMLMRIAAVIDEVLDKYEIIDRCTV